MLTYLADQVLRFLQRRCTHPGDMVSVDLLEGGAHHTQVPLLQPLRGGRPGVRPAAAAVATPRPEPVEGLMFRRCRWCPFIVPRTWRGAAELWRHVRAHHAGERWPFERVEKAS